MQNYQRSSCFLLILFVAIAFAGCAKPTPEREIKKYEARLRDAEMVKKDWVGFTPYIDEEISSKQQEFEAAKNSNDLEALQAINQNSMPLVRKLVEAHYKFKAAEDDIAKLRKLKLSKPEHEKRKKKARQLEEDLVEIDHALMNAQPADATEAMKIAQDEIGALISLGGSCRSAYRKYSKSKKKK